MAVDMDNTSIKRLNARVRECTYAQRSDETHREKEDL